MATIDILEVAGRYTTLKRKGGSGEDEEWCGPCPQCGGDDRFLVWPNEGEHGKFHCIRGCKWHGDAIDLVQTMENLNYRDARQFLGLPVNERRDTWAVKEAGVWKHYPITATYDYCDPDGKMVYQSLRWTDDDGNTKNFGQRQPDSSKKSGFRQGTKGVTLYPYRLPELIADITSGKTIYIVEGEKCVNALRKRGIAATTNVGGSGMGWRKDYNQWFAGADVVVVADYDEAGQKHARNVAENLNGIVASVTTRLSGAWNEPRGQGLDDWLDNGGALDNLPDLPEDTSSPRPGGGEGPSLDENKTDDNTAIDVTHKNLERTTEAIWAAILTSDYAKDMYRYGDNVAHLNGKLVVVERAYWRGMVNRVASFWEAKKTRQGEAWFEVLPPLAMIEDSLLFAPENLPAIERVVPLPVLDKQGKLQTNGYHQHSKTLVQTDIEPQEMDKDAALELLFGEVLCDFPFASQADKANLLAYLLTPFIREMVDAVPLFLIDAAKRGTGKGLLNDLIHIIWSGTPAETSDLPLNFEEQRKQITTHLLAAPLSVVFDDVSILQGHAIQRAITASTWNDRILGRNEECSVPVRCVFCATGNNVTLGGDMPRRVVLIRLEGVEENPSQRQGFKRSESELRIWTLEHRQDLISACCAIVIHGLKYGQPDNIRMGGFDAFARVMSTILNGCGVNGFYENMQSTLDREDTRQSGWKAIVAAWHERYSTTLVKPGDIARLIEDDDECEIHLDGETQRSRDTSAGKLLARQVGAVFMFEDGNRLQISKTKNNKGQNRYQLKVLVSPDDNPTNSVSPNAENRIPHQEGLAQHSQHSQHIRTPRPHVHARAHARTQDETQLPYVGYVGYVGLDHCNAENTELPAEDEQRLHCYNLARENELIGYECDYGYYYGKSEDDTPLSPVFSTREELEAWYAGE